MTTKFKKPIALLLAVAIAMLLNFPSGLFAGIGIGLTANAENNTETSTETSTITFTPLDGTAGGNTNENYDKLIDGNKTSGKWCVTSFSSHSSGVYIVFKASERIFVDGYTITTGNDNSEWTGRNPKNWTLKGCNDYNEENKTGTWVDINTVTNDDVLKDTNNTDYDFSFAKTTTTYQYFRLEITAIHSGDCMQMSEFTLSYNTCDHEWTKTDTTIDPTCTEGGYDVYECTQCGAEKKVPNDIPVTEHNKGEDGKCTYCGAYMISNADELKAFAALVNGGTRAANAVLTADIKVNSNLLGSLAYDTDGNVTNGDDFAAWTPIGNKINIYTGTFDGEGHTISGLYFNDASIDYVGLFGYVGEGGSVLNVGVVDSYFSGRNSVGGVCGYSNGTIENCYNTGSVSGGEYVGGVCGSNSGNTIENCYNTGSVSGRNSVGGVCGYNYSGRVTNSYNTGSVSSSNAVGGVCGFNYAGSVTNCYYLSKTSGSDRKTAAQFKSGEVAYLLSQGGENGGSAQPKSGEVAYLLSQGGGNGGSVWGQKIGTDDYPVLNGDPVYATTGCVTYNNSGDTSEKEHNYEEGICTGCGAYTEPEKDENDVYQISKVTDLYWLADTVNSGNNSVNAVLINDITVNSDLLRSLEYDNDGSVTNDDDFTAWTPIGYYSSNSDCSLYTGTFNGQGHTIGGLYFNDKNINYVGLFGCVGEGGSVSNVGIVDSYFSGSKFVGGVCGYNYCGTITNCYNTGTVSGSDDVGGVCGQNYSGRVTNSYNTGSVSGSEYVGGVCGYNNSSIKITKITNCYNEGTVSGSGNVGGVCGYNSSRSTITNCYNEGTVSSSGNVGGVCGYNDGTIENCYNTGSVSGSSDSYGVGGVCGDNDGTIENCYNTGSVSGSGDSYSVGGVCGNNDGTIENCYNTGSVSGGDNSSFVGGVCGKNSGGTITNCYYLKTDTINNDINAIGNEESDTAGKAESKTTTEFTKICELVKYHSHQNGICIWCDGYEPATLTNDKYDIDNDENKDIVYEISNVGQLYWFAGLVNGDERVCDYDSVSKPDGTQQNSSANAVLTADITVNSDLLGSLEYDNDGNVTNGTSFTAWTPIGWYDYEQYAEHYYTGTFDGAGHTISGLYFNDTAAYNVGLFGYVGTVTDENDNVISAGKVLNVGVVDSYFSGNEDVGGVCGKNEGATIENCYNTAAVSGSSEYVGGVCGKNEGTITSCYNSGTVRGRYDVGGVCGYNKGTIKNCYNTGSVNGSGNVGGVCGLNNNTIENCYNTAAVSGSSEDVGGVCGSNYVIYNGTVTNCYYLEGTASTGIGVDNTSSGIAVRTTITQFAGGEVAYLLQGAQTAATEGGTIPQVWGQKLTGETKDASPVLTSNSAKTVYKVTFATQSNSSYAVKYANPSGVYELPTAPSTDNNNYEFYKWSTSQTDYSNAANDFTETTAVAGDITVYAIGDEKYGENDNEKTVTTTYGTGTTQDLSAYTVFATGTASAGKFTYTIESGNDTKLGATIDGDTLTIPSTAAAGTYTLTIKATETSPEVSLMAVDLGTEPFTFEVAVTVNPLAENTPAIAVNYTDETLTGFDTDGSYTIGGTAVTPTDGALAVESYIGSEISIVKKASDTNHADSTTQTITIPARPNAPTGISSTKASGNDASDGTITNVDSTMEYKAADADAWQSVTGTQITGLAAGSYKVRYKATQENFASAAAEINIGVVRTYTITFVNYDNEVLQSTNVENGSIPRYSGETPTKPSDDKYSYTFTGWSPEIAEVSGIAVYAAQFARTPIAYSVELTDEGNAVVLAPDAGTYVLIFAAYDANGKMTDVELQSISFDAAGEKEFEPETLDTNGAVKVKVMLWSDIGEMSPKCGSDEMNLQ